MDTNGNVVYASDKQGNIELPKDKRIIDGKSNINEEVRLQIFLLNILEQEKIISNEIHKSALKEVIRGDRN